MDLNADGITDVLSGSYAPTKGDEGVMAGTFYVLWGSAEGFSAAEPLLGSDGERLMLPQAESKPRVDQNRICTRPTAVDLNGDGELDLVSGNFKGTFAVFAGEGEGRFAPAASWLLGPDGERLAVSAHSDPCFVDWDEDGDLDLLSGTDAGGVLLALNTGTREAAAFAAPVEVVPPHPPRRYPEPIVLGDAHVTGPQRATRVSVADVNGDGKFDLLIGDRVALTYVRDGLDEAEVLAQLQAWKEQEQAAFAHQRDAAPDERAAASKAYRELLSSLRAKRREVVRSDVTGFVWVLYQE